MLDCERREDILTAVEEEHWSRPAKLIAPVSFAGYLLASVCVLTMLAEVAMFFIRRPYWQPVRLFEEQRQPQTEKKWDPLNTFTQCLDTVCIQIQTGKVSVY